MIGWMEKAFGDEIEIKPSKVAAASLFASGEDFGISDADGVEKIDFDLVIDESHTLEFDASDHPMENGAVITDHVTQRLRTCTITGMFTNHPALKGGRDDSEWEKYADEDKGKGSVWGGYEENRALKLYNALEGLAKKRKPVRIVTSLKVYEEMIITSLPVKRTVDDGDSIAFTITLREFKVAALKKSAIFGKFKPKDMGSADNRTIAQPVSNGTVSAKQEEYVGYMIDGRLDR